jgi:hypothetical protein
MIDHLNEFPISAGILPPRLRTLLEPIGNSPDLRVDVTTRFEFDPYGPRREHVHMLMVVSPSSDAMSVSDIHEIGDGVVYFSQPDVRERGQIKEFNLSVSGLDYIVMSNGNGSFYGFHLAEKVWTALGLTPRLVGRDQQKLIYDDLSLPEFGVAEGEVSTEYYYTSTRNVNWAMSNEYLRRYLWMRAGYGVRLFYYQSLLPDSPELRKLMKGEKHAQIAPERGWYDLDIREHDGGLLIQVWATVHAVEPERCPEETAEGLVWPGIEGPMTDARANALIAMNPVYLDDRFLEKYEQSSFFNTVPRKVDHAWFCSPSYRGQWSFTNCVRVGRNMVQVPIRELYKPKPAREILHAHTHALDAAKAAEFDRNEEHIAAKTGRFVAELLRFGDVISALGRNLGEEYDAVDLTSLSRREINANGWDDYPELSRIAQVAPMHMTEQSFLSRCKSIHELWQKIPNARIRNLLIQAGHRPEDIKSLASIKLLQALANVLERLNRDGEDIDSFGVGADPADITTANQALSPLFINNDLRIADAHHAGETLLHLERLGFDVAAVNQGYGQALDHVFDGVIEAFRHINSQAEQFLLR